MAWYSGATRKNIPPGPNDPPVKPRVVILHVAATEATSLFNYFSTGSGGVESHFYIRYDGSVEQYRDTARQADANMEANDFAISIETQGLANGTWTAKQLTAIKALLSWCHNTHDIPLVVCPTWDGSGVGYHTLFEDQWDQRHASCPGPNRIQQFKDVLVPWMASGGSEDILATLDDDDIQRIAKAFWSFPGLVPGRSIWVEIVTGANRAQAAYDGIKALASTLPADTGKAVLDALSKTYEADVTLTPKESK